MEFFWQVFVNYFTQNFLPWQRTESPGCCQQFYVARRITRYYVTARGLFFLVYGEDGDERLDEAMETKVERLKILLEPCFVNTRASFVSGLRRDELTFAGVRLRAGKMKLYTQ